MGRVTEMVLSPPKGFKLTKDPQHFLVYSVNEFISTPSVDTVIFYMEGVNNC